MYLRCCCCCVLAQERASSEQWWGHLFLLGGVSGRTALGTQASSQMASRQVLSSTQVHKYISTQVHKYWSTQPYSWMTSASTHTLPSQLIPSRKYCLLFCIFKTRGHQRQFMSTRSMYEYLKSSHSSRSEEIQSTVSAAKSIPKLGTQTQAPFRRIFWNGLTFCGSRMDGCMNGGVDTSSCCWK